MNFCLYSSIGRIEVWNLQPASANVLREMERDKEVHVQGRSLSIPMNLRCTQSTQKLQLKKLALKMINDTSYYLFGESLKDLIRTKKQKIVSFFTISD